MEKEKGFPALPEGMRLRFAVPEDAERLLFIYAPYVKKTAITFEYEVPSETEFEARIKNTLTRYPYLVLEEDGEPLGYAYAGCFHDRPAYDWAVETSIYLAEHARGKGAGRILHDALEAALSEQGILNMNACIAVPAEAGDPFVTRNSEEFHAHLGYRLVGEFRCCGYKFGRWYNMVWMEKLIGGHGAEALPVKRPEEIRKALFEKYGIG
ncbi:MAG: GNAT family N-acetyltransferase [Eubacteriales bacterium]|nr:GNAT family N-acetyltransferase [Eubacteriales bacterium]